MTTADPAGRWWWSDGLFAIHGLSAGEVVPTQAVLLSHVHPDDRATVAGVLDRACALRTREPHSCEYRLRDLHGAEHIVVLAVGPDDSTPGVVSGSLVDVTRERQRAVADKVNTELALALEAHASIDQAKGVLMLALGMDSVEAFELLRSCSQRLNVRLHTLADDLVAAASRPADDEGRAGGPLVDLLVSMLRTQHVDPMGTLSTDGFRMTAALADTSAVLRVSGRLDVLHTIRLQVAIRLVQLAAGPEGVMVDLRDLEVPDAPALDIVARAARSGGGAPVVLRGRAAAPVRRQPTGA